jgi:hypothetical protein
LGNCTRHRKQQHQDNQKFCVRVAGSEPSLAIFDEKAREMVLYDHTVYISWHKNEWFQIVGFMNATEIVPAQ